MAYSSNAGILSVYAGLRLLGAGSDRILTGQRCRTKKFFATPVSFAGTRAAAAYSVVKRHLIAVKQKRAQLWRKFVRIWEYGDCSAKAETVRDTERMLAHQYGTSPVLVANGQPRPPTPAPLNPPILGGRNSEASGRGSLKRKTREFFCLSRCTAARGATAWLDRAFHRNAPTACQVNGIQFNI